MAGDEQFPVEITTSCQAAGGGVIELRSAPADEEDGMLFSIAPISLVELPAEGGGRAGAPVPHLTVMSFDRRPATHDLPADGGARTRRARQILRAILHPAERVAS